MGSPALRFIGYALLFLWILCLLDLAFDLLPFFFTEDTSGGICCFISLVVPFFFIILGGGRKDQEQYQPSFQDSFQTDRYYAPRPRVEFPAAVFCPYCGKPFRARTTGHLRCPHCEKLAVVDGWGNILSRTEIE